MYKQNYHLILIWSINIIHYKEWFLKWVHVLKRKSNIPLVFMPINSLFVLGYLSFEKLKLLTDQPQQGLFCLHCLAERGSFSMVSSLWLQTLAGLHSMQEILKQELGYHSIVLIHKAFSLLNCFIQALVFIPRRSHMKVHTLRRWKPRPSVSTGQTDSKML